MNEKDKRKAQLLMIKILKEVHSICMKNNIKYFLHFGTLIGAVRHNGFIPWDDDIDIGMLRPDYEKFLKIVKKNLGKDYIVQNQKTDKGFAFCFTKIMLKDTVWIEQNSIKTNKKYNGIYIDIFPFDKVPAYAPQRTYFYEICRLLNYFTLCKYKINEQKSTDKHALIKKIFITVVPKFIFSHARNLVFKKYKKLTSEYLISGLWNKTVKHPLSEDFYKELVLHRFEDSEFYIPTHYHEVLSAFFGDYMQMPPESERISHGIIEYDFGKYGDSI